MEAAMINDCVFCDNAELEMSLICESGNSYILADMNQITDGGHVLFAPKAHVPCIGAIEESQIEELELLARCICATISSEYDECPVTVFEHGIVGQTIKHAHLHFLPAHINITEIIGRDFPAAEKDVVNSFANLAKAYRKNPESYLFWITRDEPPQVCWDPPAPPQYLRMVAAEEVQHPERVNWRTMDKELYKKFWQETVTRLQGYFK